MTPDQMQDIVIGTIHAMMSSGDLRVAQDEMEQEMEPQGVQMPPEEPGEPPEAPGAPEQPQEAPEVPQSPQMTPGA